MFSGRGFAASIEFAIASWVNLVEMLKRLTCLLTFGSFAVAGSAPPPVAFWKAKPKVYERIQNREIIVAVDSTSADKSPRHALAVNGGGQVTAPCDFTYEKVNHYEEMARLTDYVSDPVYHPDSKTLTLHMNAYGYQADLTVAIEAKDKATPKALAFRIVKGPMKDFAGQLAFDPIKADKCEIGITGAYRYDEFPLPKIFLEFAMEFVFQRMASRLRTHVEDAYEKRLDKKS